MPGHGANRSPPEKGPGWLAKLAGAEKYEALAERGLEYADLSLAEMKRHNAETERLLSELIDLMKCPTCGKVRTCGD